jgi:hypothetical protein
MMRTYVRMIFSTEGAGPRAVAKIMEGLGFEPALGTHDFVYKWKKKTELEEVLDLIEKMHAAMKGMDLRYEVTTVG